jgi:transcriptional regulator with XRE-family HTH domain
VKGGTMALLLREAIGDSLRRARTAQSRTLREVSGSARVSLGYLSEVERGRKEASSELLAAICDALEVPLSQVFGDVSEALATVEQVDVSAPPAPTRSVENIADGTRVVISAPGTVRVAAHAA